jgi:hypothetical protein
MQDGIDKKMTPFFAETGAPYVDGRTLAVQKIFDLQQKELIKNVDIQSH